MQHGVVLRHNRNHNGRVFRALALMDTCGIAHWIFGSRLPNHLASCNTHQRPRRHSTPSSISAMRSAIEMSAVSAPTAA